VVVCNENRQIGNVQTSKLELKNADIKLYKSIDYDKNLNWIYNEKELHDINMKSDKF